ncbi:MAG: DUF1552 domain-containing protein [Planctomycetaceae bacterium]|nr:DUF1552 domain-containing protein [Planctomycetaceae bacterium]
MNRTRRTFLRGAAGSVMALPWLDSLAVGLDSATVPAKRLAVFYVPIGVVRRGFFPGEQEAAIPEFSSDQVEINVENGLRPGVRPLQHLTPTQEPLADVREHVTLITGMDRFYKHGSDVHAQCGSCFLSSATPDSVTSSVYPQARTLDHIVADHIGRTTPLSTLELSCNSHKDNKESMYFDNISWYDTGYVAPSLRDPRKAFQRLFGSEESRSFRNITDLVLEDARALQKQLSRDDRAKFEEYFDSVRTIEQQLKRREELRIDLTQVGLELPPDAWLPRGEYIRLMGDLMVAALQTGMTNVATLMVGPERWDTPWMYESLFDKPMSHHQMSHQQQKYLKELLMVDRFHMEQFAYLVGRMNSIQEKDGGTLLDSTILIYGSGLGDGATHQYTDLPLLVAGGQLRTGLHLHCPDGTPLANFWLTCANVLGAPLDHFADSTGVLSELTRG